MYANLGVALNGLALLADVAMKLQLYLRQSAPFWDGGGQQDNGLTRSLADGAGFQPTTRR